ncbi:MAG: hypothetical protein ACF8XB_22525, partial [Planctomycetota bacterium JB042]
VRAGRQLVHAVEAGHLSPLEKVLQSRVRWARGRSKHPLSRSRRGRVPLPWFPLPYGGIEFVRGSDRFAHVFDEFVGGTHATFTQKDGYRVEGGLVHRIEPDWLEEEPRLLSSDGRDDPVAQRYWLCWMLERRERALRVTAAHVGSREAADVQAGEKATGRRGGRPRTSDSTRSDEDVARVYERWRDMRDGDPTLTFEEGARCIGGGITGDELGRLIDRCRKRRAPK